MHLIVTFARKDQGSLTLLSLLLFVVMFLIGGLAVDMLAYENNRVRLQNLSDRATLAAADLDQTANPVDVVNSYFEKEGLAGYLDAINVVEDGGARTVEIVASRTVPTMFMRMVGTTELLAPARSMASEASGDVEISLVLDNSGSMGAIDGGDGQTRLNKLQEAVDTFLTIMYPEGTDTSVTVSVVPYATQVNAGPMLTSRMSVTDEHAYSDCIEFAAADFGTLGIDFSETYDRSGHFAMFETGPVPTYWKCRPEAAQHVYVMGSNPDVIRGKVDALTAHGQTSLELGAKWGAALLDPSTNGLIQSLISDPDADVLPEHADRPVAYSNRATIKALILMTDGINTVHYNLTPPYKSGMSDMYRVNATLTEIYATPGLSVNHSLATVAGWGEDVNTPRTVYIRQLTEVGDFDADGVAGEGFWLPAVRVGNTTVVPAQWIAAPIVAVAHPGTESPNGHMKWVELWDAMPPGHYANAYVRTPRNDNAARTAFLNAVYTTVEAPTKDARLATLCETAKAQGLTVYTVGLSVNDHARGVLRACATTENFFLDANSDSLEGAFQDIAESILALKLRLIQ